MISASNSVKNLLKQNTSVTIGAGCTIEYNMNEMVNRIDVTNAREYSQIPAGSNGYKPFTNVFPHKSVCESNRPEYAGIKHAVLGDISARKLEVSPGLFASIPDYRDPKDTTYPLNYRTYIPGVDNKYKYYLSNKNDSVNLSLEYKNSDGTDKIIFTNKIVVKFEISHSMPSSGTISTRWNGSTYTAQPGFTNSNIKAFGTDAPGTLTMYYNGATWSFSESHLVPGVAAQLTGIKLEVNAKSSSDGDNYIGVIEILPKYVIDASSDLISFDINKEASIDQEITPVGIVSANSLVLSLNKWTLSPGQVTVNTNDPPVKIVSYDKSSVSFLSDRVYLYKEAEIKPFLKVYYTGAPLSDSVGSYEKVSQGTFYMDSWDVDQYGNTTITALDGAKKLQQTFCPELLCQDFSITAVIRRLLDSVGFTNYKININSVAANENSIINLTYWWSDSSKTVWQAIQELCKDSQMVATFDENNVLQFYTRNYFYDSTRTVAWELNYQQEGSVLPNIVSFNKKEFRSGNKLIVRWNSKQTTQDNQEGRIIWSAGKSWLAALALAEEIPDSTTVGKIKFTPIVTSKELEDSIPFSFTGYLLVDSEILEYDAIEYQYSTIQNPASDSDWTKIDILSESDFKKYKSLAYLPNSRYFRSSGRIRIKSRGAFGTVAEKHTATVNNSFQGWTTANVGWR